MDEPAIYGKNLFVITFSQAVSQNLLVNYKIIILSVKENYINRRLQELLKDHDNALKVDNATKIVGCWKSR